MEEEEEEEIVLTNKKRKDPPAAAGGSKSAGGPPLKRQRKNGSLASVVKTVNDLQLPEVDEQPAGMSDSRIYQKHLRTALVEKADTEKMVVAVNELMERKRLSEISQSIEFSKKMNPGNLNPKFHRNMEAPCTSLCGKAEEVVVVVEEDDDGGVIIEEENIESSSLGLNSDGSQPSARDVMQAVIRKIPDPIEEGAEFYRQYGKLKNFMGDDIDNPAKEFLEDPTELQEESEFVVKGPNVVYNPIDFEEEVLLRSKKRRLNERDCFNGDQCQGRTMPVLVKATLRERITEDEWHYYHRFKKWNLPAEPRLCLICERNRAMENVTETMFEMQPAQRKNHAACPFYNGTGPGQYSPKVCYFNSPYFLGLSGPVVRHFALAYQSHETMVDGERVVVFTQPGYPKTPSSSSGTKQVFRMGSTNTRLGR